MKWFYDLWDDFISLLFPRLCYGCGNHLLRNENIICTECFVVIPRANYHLDLNNPVAQLFWGRCTVQKAAAFSFYNSGSRIRNLIHSLKYKGIREIGTELGKLYGLSLKSSGFTYGMDLIIPVPLHPSKQRLRGFNQSEIISRGIAEVTGLPVVSDSICRIMKSQTQTKKTRYERWANVEGIFSINEPELLKNRHVLLVDDVITTGSTIESCTNELLKIEGVKVSVVALACAII